MDENGYFTNPNATKLTLQILVTSICDTLVEIEFDAVREWQIKDCQYDMQGTSVFFYEQNHIVWLNDVFISMDELKKGCYAIARSMKWRIVE